MTVAAAAVLWAAWLGAAAALGLAASAVAGTDATDQLPVEFIEPSSLYKTDGHCRYNYDALQREPLKFNLTVTCSWRCSAVIISRLHSNTAVNGCREWCDEDQGTCSLGCTASEALRRVADEGAYQIIAEPRESNVVVPATTFNICVNLQDRPYVRFVGTQTTDVTSENGSAVLSYFADGYPQRVIYELACDEQRAASLSFTGSLTLTNLTDGLTRCTVVAYTSRRLAATAPLAVMIKVVPGKPSTSTSNGRASLTHFVEADSRSSTSLPSTSSEMVQSLTSSQQQVDGDTKDTALIVGIVIPCVVMVSISMFLVGCAAYKRRREQSAAISEGAGDRRAQRSTPHVGPIINNSSTIYNYYGDHIEVLGPGSSVVVHGGGRSKNGDGLQSLDVGSGGC